MVASWCFLSRISLSLLFDVFLPGAQAQRCEIPSELNVLTKLKTKHHLVTIGHTMLRYVIFHV